MGAIDPKLIKGGRKLKKAKHCTIPNLEQNNRKIDYELRNRNGNKKVEKEKDIVENM